jgi:Holliday junction resolvase RusA-like endonuclease
MLDQISTAEAPFHAPPPQIIDLHLPMPPSTNRIWQRTKAGPKKFSKSDDYKAWIEHADDVVRSMGGLRGVRPLPGRFEARVILQRKPGSDLDNRLKGLLDWAQARTLIVNDNLCERIVAEWGEAPLGCRLILKGWDQ